MTAAGPTMQAGNKIIHQVQRVARYEDAGHSFLLMGTKILLQGVNKVQKGQAGGEEEEKRLSDR